MARFLSRGWLVKKANLRGPYGNTKQTEAIKLQVDNCVSYLSVLYVSY